MKSTTATYKSILASKSARHYLIKIDLELASGTTLHLTGADIWEDSFSIDTASSGTSSFDIGTAVIGQCKFTLNNINGTFDNYDFFNAEATVWLGLEGDVSGSPATQQYYRMGFYTVDEPSKANGLISLTLLDNMWKFDVPFSEAGVTFTSQTTARSIVNTMCSHCGVTLATQSFHGYDFSITSAPEEIDDLELDAHVLIFADHGNAEQMVDYKTGMVKTSHTLNLVDCFYVANDAAGVRLTPLAKLSAVAPTALQMLGLPVPPEMTTPSLLAGKEPWSKTALAI